MASSMSPPSSSPLAAAGSGPSPGLPADASGLATAGSGPSPGLPADASGLATAGSGPSPGLPADASGLAAAGSEPSAAGAELPADGASGPDPSSPDTTDPELPEGPTTGSGTATAVSGVEGSGTWSAASTGLLEAGVATPSAGTCAASSATLPPAVARRGSTTVASSMSPSSSSPLATVASPASPSSSSPLAAAGPRPSSGLPADGSGLAAVVFAAVSEVDGNGTWSAVNTGRFDDDTSESEASPLSGAADDGLLGDSADGSGALSAGLWLTSPSKHFSQMRIDLTQGLLPVLLPLSPCRHAARLCQGQCP